MKTIGRFRGDTLLPGLILLIPGALFAGLAPYLPVDETRYLTVAWEMWQRHSFLVPFLNGAPYADKPPFLFWLINLDWLLLGVNEATLRFIPLLFSLLNVGLVYRLGKLLWNDERTARYATFIFASLLIYLVWSALIMFDVLLTFWILLGLTGILSLRRGRGPALTLVSLAVAGGMVTKGPVVLVYLLPVPLWLAWASPARPEAARWKRKAWGAMLAGLAWSALWIVPAVREGGEAYQQSLLWHQTVHRVAASFAHSRPVWWYFPLLPLLFFPWILTKPVWRLDDSFKRDSAYRFLALWSLASLVIFSLISGKQIHYLIPMLPAVSLLMARNARQCAARVAAGEKAPPCRCLYLALFYLAAGLAALFPTAIQPGSGIGRFSAPELRLLAAGFLSQGAILYWARTSSVTGLMRVVAVSSATAAVICVLALQNGFFPQHNLRPFARLLGAKQAEGYNIIHYGRYAGQYQFLGRLTKPLVVLRDQQAIRDYVARHPQSLLIVYERRRQPREETGVLYQQPYRDRFVKLLDARGIQRFLSPPPAASRDTDG